MAAASMKAVKTSQINTAIDKKDDSDQNMSDSSESSLKRELRQGF